MNLSPFLFNLYINDLENYLLQNNIDGIKSFSEKIENEMQIMFKLFILFYADDTVLISDNPEDLQRALNIFSDYCDHWKLQVNTDKTKIVIFSRGRIPKNIFLYREAPIEIVNEFKYLGVIMSRSGFFKSAKTHLTKQASKAMYGVLRKIRYFNLPVDCQIDLFDKVISPILLYGCEVWGLRKHRYFRKGTLEIFEIYFAY